MLNLLIAKKRGLRKSFYNFLDLKSYGIRKVVTIEEFEKDPFRNFEDIDFIIADTVVLETEGCKLYNQLSDKGLNNRIILLGPEEDYKNLTYILYNGVKLYEPNLDMAKDKITELFNRRIKEKKHEIFIMSQLHDGVIVKKVKQALDKGDSRLIQKTISYGNKLLPAPIFQIKEYYLLIMKTVFEFAEEKGIKKIDRKEIISEFLELSEFDAVKEYALKKVNRIIHLVEVNKNNKNVMVAEHIKDYIDKNYDKQDTNAGNIAELFGVSGSYIGTLFREQQKTTITKYITQLRITKAEELLLNTKLQIQVISNKVGYSDQNYFARIFKKQTGLSPGEYRNKCSH